MLVFVAQISEENSAVYLGWSFKPEDIESDFFHLKYRTGQLPILLDEYTTEIDSNLESYLSLMRIRLKKRGFNVISKIDADNNRRLYVIHINSPDSNMLYVGQTGYEIEVRFLQHKNDVLSDRGYPLSAKIFKNYNNVPHSIAYGLILDTNTYHSTYDAENAEASLAAKLESIGYVVHFS